MDLLFKSLNHEGGDLVGHSSADCCIERVDELIFDGEADLGRRRRSGLLGERRQVPQRLERLEDGRRILGRAAVGRATATRLDRDAGDAAQAAGEGLVKAAPAHMQVGEGGPAATGRVWRGPLRDAGVRAVGHKGRIGIDVCDELVQGLLAVREGARRDEALGGASGEGDEGAARG